MLHLTVLASGSSGNCALVETPTTRVLIDAGLSAKRVADRLAAAGVAPEQLDGILLTHEHSSTPPFHDCRMHAQSGAGHPWIWSTPEDRGLLGTSSSIHGHTWMSGS